MTERLNVVADLRVEVDGDVVRVTGEGDHLQVTADHPARLLRHATGFTHALELVSINDSAARPLAVRVATIASRLSDTGLTITLAGPRRDVVHVGANTGRGHVRLAVPHRISQAAAGLVTAAVIVLMIRTRRR